MKPYYETPNGKLYHGACEDVMAILDSNSIDTIITDPPYGLRFMGKKWDYDVPSTEIWQECLRVLKPGGTALIFAGSRRVSKLIQKNTKDLALEFSGAVDEHFWDLV